MTNTYPIFFESKLDEMLFKQWLSLPETKYAMWKYFRSEYSKGSPCGDIEEWKRKQIAFSRAFRLHLTVDDDGSSITTEP